MLRGTLHLVDLQQQLVFFWLVGTWNSRIKWVLIPVKDGGNILGKKKNKQENEAFNEFACGKRKKTYTGRDPTEKEDTPAFWITALYISFIVHLTRHCAKSDIHPSATCHPLGNKGGWRKTMLFNMTGQCKRKCLAPAEDPSQAGLGDPATDCHTSKHKQVPAKEAALLGGWSSAFLFLSLSCLFSVNSAALPVLWTCQSYTIDPYSHE